MNKFSGSCTGPGGTFDYEAMWSEVGERIFWDSRVTKQGSVIGAPGGVIVDRSADAATLITAALHEAINAGLRRQNERNP